MIDFSPTADVILQGIAGLISNSLNLIAIGLISIAVSIVIAALIYKSKK